MFPLFLCTACRAQNGNTTYYLNYEPAGITLETMRRDGLFYVLEQPFETQSPYGHIRVDSCYYDGEYVSLNLTLSDIPDVEKLKKATDSHNDCTASVFGIPLHRKAIWSAELQPENPAEPSGSYTIGSGSSTGSGYYYGIGFQCSARSISQLSVTFLGENFKLSLTEKKGEAR